MTLGAKLFIIVLILIPVLLTGSLFVENQQPVSISVAKKKKKKNQIKFNDLYKFVKENREWYPFTYGLLEFYK